MLEVGPHVTCETSVNIFPDACAYLKRIATSYGEGRVRQLMDKIGYTQKELKPSEFTMHQCFAGMLSNVPLKACGRYEGDT